MEVLLVLVYVVCLNGLFRILVSVENVVVECVKVCEMLVIGLEKFLEVNWKEFEKD